MPLLSSAARFYFQIIFGEGKMLPVPRKNPIPEAERAICKRLREFREHVGISRAEFAKRLGLDWMVYANYELGRVKVPYRVAAIIGAVFGLSFRWLAEDVSPLRGYVALPEEITLRIDQNAPFSLVFERLLKPHMESYWQAAKDIEDLRGDLATLASGNAPQLSPDQTKKGARAFWMLRKEWIPAQKIRASHLRAMGEKILQKADDIDLGVKEAEDFHAREQSAVPRSLRGPGVETPKQQREGQVSVSKLTVDMPAASDKVPDVSSVIPTWKQIVAALKRLTNSPGAKAQLAVDLDTSRQNVNKWLSGAGAPSADLTLEVFRWVEKHGGWKQK